MLLPTNPSMRRQQRERRGHHDQHGDDADDRDADAGRRAHRSMPSSEITTVAPANNTARPAVPIARRRPPPRGSRPACEATAVAGDDEQGVVDADAEPDHHGRTRREVRHSIDRDAERDRREPSNAEPEERGEDRQAHGQHGSEGDEQDHDRRADADEFAQPEQGRLTEHAGQLDLQTRLIVGGDGLDGLEGGVVEPLLCAGGLELHFGEHDVGGLRRDDEGANLDDLRHGSQVVDRAVDGDLLAPSTISVALNTMKAVAPARFGKALVEKIERLLRVGARQLEALAEVATKRTRHRIDADEHEHPRDEHTPAAAVAASTIHFRADRNGGAFLPGVSKRKNDIRRVAQRTSALARCCRGSSGSSAATHGPAVLWIEHKMAGTVDAVSKTASRASGHAQRTRV